MTLDGMMGFCNMAAGYLESPRDCETSTCTYDIELVLLLISKNTSEL